MKKLRLATLTVIAAMTTTSAFASNEMYVLGGAGMDSGDIGAQFTLGSQIAQSNWYIESTLLVISTDDKSTQYLDDSPLHTEEAFDSLMVSLTPMYKHSFSDTFSIYGKFGAFYSHSDTKLEYRSSEIYQVHKGSHGDLGLTYGIGAEYKSLKPVFGNSKFVTRAGYDWYEFGGSTGWYTPESVLGIQVGFTF